MEFQIGVKALIENNGKILLIKRSSKYGEMQGYWDIPGGRIKFGEEPEEGLRREVLEETGLKIDKLNGILDASTVWKDEAKHIVRITYLCQSIEKDIKTSNEHTEIAWTKPFDINFALKDQLIARAINIAFGTKLI